ncbi:uncharacterized protein EAF02_008621 [Botrytis sinoallii]|uniref:uncharacterized protein n=1 Tax=Botrytis sinoallii TaxID=1463999 RepID=UPI001900811C|nr:uncharacterized protein EAF02_008621 [Botrytis sinoallii]KAF7874644.1 hypothetical protein EAF02_008621 [Botrytis sinoallii]
MSSLTIASRGASLCGKIVGRDTALLSSYDFIVVGGGTSGPVRQLFSLLRPVNLIREKISYTFHFSQELGMPATNNRSIAIPLGKVLGGGSCLNKMAFDLAGKEDYDRWIEVGAVGWNELFPYFKKLTKFTPPASEIAKEWDIQTDHSAHGYKANLMKSVLRIDVLADRVYRSIQVIQHLIGHHSYIYASMKYLGIRKELQSFGGEYAAGSNFSRSTVLAAKEVVLAAGAIHSPQLLQLSGIGSSSLPKQFGIETVVSLPGVGANFQDHPSLRASTTLDIYLSANNLTSNATFNAEVLALYRHNRIGHTPQKGEANMHLLETVLSPIQLHRLYPPLHLSHRHHIYYPMSTRLS